MFKVSIFKGISSPIDGSYLMMKDLRTYKRITSTIRHKFGAYYGITKLFCSGNDCVYYTYGSQMRSIYFYFLLFEESDTFNHFDPFY